MSCQNLITILWDEQNNEYHRTHYLQFRAYFYPLPSLKSVADYGSVCMELSFLSLLPFLLISACQDILGFLAAPCYTPCWSACQLLYSFPLAPT